ncbi:MAG: AAA family ATPase [Proteobacteria bacterium]|nr:AAA family ATPase [Pseudomonadota bacterium]
MAFRQPTLKPRKAPARQAARARPRRATDAASDSETLVRSLQRRLGAKLVETHISWLLLDGVHAWKIKKPVRLPFLDARRLDVRRRLCEDELRLNRRLAPELYLDVVPIRGTPAGPRLRGRGPIIEHAVRMRQFASGALFTERLAAGRLTPEEVDALAARLAAFHRAAPVAGSDTRWGEPDLIAAQAAGAADSLAKARPGDPRCTALRAWLAEEALRQRPEWTARKACGAVREGHGDLHAANLVVLDAASGVTPTDVTAFDCIEFDPALRWIDVVRDIAFAVMDLRAHGRSDLAWRLLNAWLDETGEHAGVTVLRHALVERALVRAMVATLHPSASPDYLALAVELASLRDPRLLITHGLSGSGKSHYAQRLLERAGAVRLRSDVERKRLHGLAPLQDSGAVPGGIYAPDATRRTYGRLHVLADLLLRAGHPVIVDAAFLRRDEREDFRRLAQARGAPFTILDCRAPDHVLLARIRARQARRDDPSEADERVVAAQRRHAEPLDASEVPHTLVAEAPGATDVDQLSSRWLAAPAACPSLPQDD